MARPAMTDCPECREEFGLTIGPRSTIPEAWSLFYKAYEEHYDAAHADSWQKLARDAVTQWRRPVAPVLVNAAALEDRLAKLEAKQ